MQSIAEQPEQSVLPPSTEQQTERECQACGTRARRASARFCATCGHALDEGYLPADTLRASYHQQQQRFVRQRQQSRRPSVRMNVRGPRHAPVKPLFPAANSNSASTTALAFVTYSLVPYLGILFCPGAIVMGGIGLLNWQRMPQRGGRRAASASIILGLVILCVQLLLWWILYKVPQWARL